MMQKRGLAEFGMSEPEFLISVMDRKEDWCTIVCLVGGGQEINQHGRSGPNRMVRCPAKTLFELDVYYPNQIAHKDYSWGQDLESKLKHLKSEAKQELHLAVSMRSYRAEKLFAFVDAVIDGDIDVALRLYETISRDYPIALTRDIGNAREWLRQKARGNERCGLVASSGAIRLKPEGINVKAGIDPVMWFLNSKEDIRFVFLPRGRGNRI